MNGLSDALAILSAMITPAVLISACGSLIMATSGRLNRAVDRARETSRRFAELAAPPAAGEPADESREKESRMLFSQLDFSTTRSRLLQRAMARLYWALGMFVATSVAIGMVAVSSREYAWVPIAFGLVGAGCLLYASLLLVHESRLALTALEAEMDFVWQQGRAQASPELLDLHRRPSGLFLRRR
jgi:hypothetical protein